MGLCNSPDIFQEKMSELFFGSDTLRVYIDDLLHVTKSSWTEHLTVLEYVFSCLQKAVIKVNSGKSWFGAHKFEYLGYHVTRDSVITIPKKVEAIQDLAVPKTRKQLRQFIGMINFYRDMWQKRSDILPPFTALISKNVKYQWTDEHQKCFDEIKRVIEREVFMAYLNYNAPFEIHINASKLQIGAVISQKGKPIAFYSQNINSAPKNYHNWEITPFHCCISQVVP